MQTIALALVLGLSAAPPAAAQEESTEQKYRAKLEESFVSNVDWVHSFAEAQQKAKEKRQLIFGYFSRSYAP